MSTCIQFRPSSTSSRSAGRGLILTTVLLLTLATTATGTTISVTSTAWGDDGESTCTLWEAVKTAKEASSTGGCRWISGSAAAVIELAADTTYKTEGQLPKIVGGVTINGHGARIEAATSASDHRFFNVGGTGSLNLVRLTLAGGRAPRGGAIWISQEGKVEGLRLELSDNQATIAGGAIYSRGEVDLIFATLRNNAAVSGGALAADRGRLDVFNSTFSGNTATNRGGAIVAWSNVDQLTFRNSTFSGNEAFEGGALYRSGPSNTPADTVEQVTFKGNSILPAGSGSSLYLAGDRAFAIEKTALHGDADLCAGDLAGLASGGHNAATDASCALTHLDDHEDVTFTLTEALVDDGAFTKVHIPLCDIPADEDPFCSILFDQYPCENVGRVPDQRGVDRFNFGDGLNNPAPLCDIGAYESICHTSIADPDSVTTLLYTDQYKSDGNVLNNGSCAGAEETFTFDPVPADGCQLAWQVHGLSLGIRAVWFLEPDCELDCFADPAGCQQHCTADNSDWEASLPSGVEASADDTTADDAYFVVDVPTCYLERVNYVMEFVDGEVDFWDPETAIESGDGT
ncbi:MAG: hypothetical protein AAF604_17295 [Acidobacteriota bacterium]